MIKKSGRKILGTNCADFSFFPMLIKLIDARDNLSVQVHPSDDFAFENEGQYGKTEIWYILDAVEGAGIYYGFKEKISIIEYVESKSIRTSEIEAIFLLPCSSQALLHTAA